VGKDATNRVSRPVYVPPCVPDITTRFHLLEWIATTFPGLSRAQFEAGYRLLANPDITDEAAEQVEVMLRGCSEAAKERRHE
jgi:hypothetical protein